MMKSQASRYAHYGCLNSWVPLVTHACCMGMQHGHAAGQLATDPSAPVHHASPCCVRCAEAAEVLMDHGNADVYTLPREQLHGRQLAVSQQEKQAQLGHEAPRIGRRQQSPAARRPRSAPHEPQSRGVAASGGRRLPRPVGPVAAAAIAGAQQRMDGGSVWAGPQPLASPGAADEPPVGNIPSVPLVEPLPPWATRSAVHGFAAAVPADLREVRTQRLGVDGGVAQCTESIQCSHRKLAAQSLQCPPPPPTPPHSPGRS